MTMRYVPEGAVSLSSDAPGWTVKTTDDNSPAESRGPICWKCKGECNLRVLKKNAPSNQRICPVCKGSGFLPMKSKYVQSISTDLDKPGVITSRRRRPRGWNEFGHVPAAVQASLHIDTDDSDEKTTTQQALSILRQANGHDDDYDSKRHDVSATIAKGLQEQNCPSWLPINSGEQLCNLVGRWRILQRVGSHRWTTDDLVTAYVAASTFISSNNTGEGDSSNIRYLDLGTGNASVLQMTTWYLLSSELRNHPYHIEAYGVEARTEAVGFARRSLSFNLGTIETNGKKYTGSSESITHNVEIVNGDFRDLIHSTDLSDPMQQVASERYDLITGTPPYFRIDFSGSDEKITEAVINQGGMPTSMQSAPARCEFRGGIEAYCQAAAAMLQPEGIFVVCENWLNDKRAYNGAKIAGLDIVSVWPVMGRVGKPEPLFAVYVMRKQSESYQDITDVQNKDKIVRDPLIVRGEDGKWTEQYAEVMKAMSIPVV
mmetsp:Transcript_12590/g.25086  ORF Transcript_12590/g.25086 Transcript_12590/m.25086 type:complete len:487 (+) Transcript_12590:44-1504(+)